MLYFTEHSIVFMIDKSSDKDAVKEFANMRLREPTKIGTKEYKDTVNKLIKGSKIKGHRGWELLHTSEKELRKLKGFPIRGQRTHTNAKSAKKLNKRLI